MTNHTTDLVHCLTIGSSDSSGGAGVQGDIRALGAMGAYAATVLVGITAQDTRQIRRRYGLPLTLIADQLETVLADIRIDAIKVGTTWNDGVIHLLSERLRHVHVPIIVDPVMGTASGVGLGGRSRAIAALRSQLLPLATVVTPNVFEARRLVGDAADTDVAVLAQRVAATGASAVLITDALPDGGDWLFDGQHHHPIPGTRVAAGCDHGAGCAHSAVLAALLGRGVGLLAAARSAHRMVAAGVECGARDVGHGHHPVDLMAGIGGSAPGLDCG